MKGFCQSTLCTIIDTIVPIRLQKRVEKSIIPGESAKHTCKLAQILTNSRLTRKDTDAPRRLHRQVFGYGRDTRRIAAHTK